MESDMYSPFVLDFYAGVLMLIGFYVLCIYIWVFITAQRLGYSAVRIKILPWHNSGMN